MPTDPGFWMLMAAFVAGVLAFGFGWAVTLGMRRRRGRNGEPPPLPVAEGRGAWRVSSSIFGPADLAVVLFLVGIYSLGMWYDLFGLSSDEPVAMNRAAVGATIAMQLVLTSMVIGFVALRRRPSEWLGLRWRHWPLALPIAIGVVAVMLLFMGLLQISGYLSWLERVQGGDGMQEVVRAFGETDDVTLLTMLSATAVLVAPVCEEVLFRGYVYPVAKHFAGRGPAIVFSALVFAVAHNNAMALLPLAVLAVLLVLVYEWTGSIWTPIAAHMLFNSLTVVAQLLARNGMIPG